MQAGLSFGLTSRYSSVFDLTAAAVCGAALPEGAVGLDALFVRVGLTTAVLPKIAASRCFPALIAALIEGGSDGRVESGSSEGSRAFEADLWNADRAARQLYAAGCWSEAGLLLMNARGIPTAYRTLGLASTLLRAFTQ